jgi:penicillin-binding protein 1A
LVELRLQGDDTPLIGQDGGMGERVISEQAAQELTYMLTQVIEAGTGGRAALPDRQVAGKTGTTQAARDAWFVGFSANYVTGVWMGYDDNTPLTGVTGAGLPAEIWREVMLRVHQGVPVTPLPMIIPAPRRQPNVPASPDTASTTTTSSAQSQSAAPVAAGQADRPDMAESILRQVLGAFGNKNN